MANEQKVVERLRELIAELGGKGYRDKHCAEYNEIDGILYEFGYEEDGNFERGGHWIDYGIAIYSIGVGDSKTYFRFTEEIPASGGMPEGMPLSFWIEEVEPVEVKTIEWMPRE